MKSPTNQLHIVLLADKVTSVAEHLSKFSDLNLVARVQTSDDVMNHLNASKVDIVVMDLALANLNPVSLIKEIRAANSQVRVLVFTPSNAPEDIFAAMDAGADAYILKDNLAKYLDIALRSAQLGAVWLDPGIAQQVLEAIEHPPAAGSRMLPTGFLPMPLMPHERSTLSQVATGNCKDGVCLVDPAFVRKLKRFKAS